MPVPNTVVYKIVRAQEHLQELEAEIRRYCQTDPAKIVRQREGAPNDYIGRFTADKPIPARIPIILGDCFQNLRSSLDYLVWELVLAAKNTPAKHNMFPICSSPEAFKDALVKQRRLEGVSDIAKTVIECLQPYNCGDYRQSILWFIDELCNTNKHRRLLLTNLEVGMAPDDMESHIIDGQLWVRADLDKVKRDTKIGPFPMIDTASGPSVKVPMQFQFVAFIAFDEGVAKGRHATAVMEAVIDYVRDSALPLFNEFFP